MSLKKSRWQNENGGVEIYRFKLFITTLHYRQNNFDYDGEIALEIYR
jgi:hypothetical protein